VAGGVDFFGPKWHSLRSLPFQRPFRAQPVLQGTLDHTWICTIMLRVLNLTAGPEDLKSVLFQKIFNMASHCLDSNASEAEEVGSPYLIFFFSEELF
jgi:hypothetical protein